MSEHHSEFSSDIPGDHSAPLSVEDMLDDAIDYFTPGDPITDTKAPEGPIS
jgi:hypothetical protein